MRRTETALISKINECIRETPQKEIRIAYTACIEVMENYPDGTFKKIADILSTIYRMRLIEAGEQAPLTSETNKLVQAIMHQDNPPILKVRNKEYNSRTLKPFTENEK